MISWWLDATIPAPRRSLPGQSKCSSDPFHGFGRLFDVRIQVDTVCEKNMCLCNIWWLDESAGRMVATARCCHARGNGCSWQIAATEHVQWTSMNINHSIMSSKHLQHMKSQLTREDHWSKMIQESSHGENMGPDSILRNPKDTLYCSLFRRHSPHKAKTSTLLSLSLPISHTTKTNSSTHVGILASHSQATQHQLSPSVPD